MCPSPDPSFSNEKSYQERFRLAGAMQTHPGANRPINEDSAAYVLPHPDAPFARIGALALVADGMGGHAAGEVASGLAVDIISGRFYDLAGPVPDVLAACFEAANRAIYELSTSDPKCAGMGTTCTVIAVRHDMIYLGHIGDSRAYILREGSLRQISQDHSVVADLVRKGTITESEAMRSPYRNLVLRALGRSPAAEPQVWSEGLPLQVNDVIVLCSDGLSDILDDDVIVGAVQGLAPLPACRALMSAVLEKGGKDNISLGIFVVQENSTPMSKPEQATRTIIRESRPGAGP